MLKHGLLSLSLFFATIPLVAQEIQHPVVRFSHPDLSKINSLVEARKYKRAIELSLASAEERKTRADREGYISFMLRAAEIETFEVWKGKGFPGVELYPDYRRPLRYLQQLNKNAGRFLDQYPYLKANTLFTNAVVYHWLDMPDTAEVLHNQALDLRKKIYGPSSREVADSYLWRGVLYNWGQHRRDLAEPDYNRAKDLQNHFLPASRYALGSVYYGLANIAMETFQYDEALTLANKYLQLYHDIPYEQAFGLQLIANLYWNKRDFEKALEFRNRAVKLYEQSDFKEDLIIEYSNLSIDLLNLKRYPDAKRALKQGERILATIKEQDPYYAKMLLENFGNLHLEMKRYDSAAIYFQKALNIAVNHYGERNDEVAHIYRMTGQMFREQMLFEDALRDYQKMLIALIPGFNSTEHMVSPPIQYENPYFQNIISAFFDKANAYLLWYTKTRDIRHLESALKNYRMACRQIIVARNTIGDELSKPFLTARFHESIENSLQCARLLYDKTKESRFHDDLLYFMEFTKYLNVLDALERAERANNSEVPLELLFKLREVRSELSKLQQIELQHTHLAVSMDSLAHVRDRILDLVRVRRQIIMDIEGYSGQRPYKPDSMMITLQNIQKRLKPDEQILEFFWGRDSIYTVSITDRQVTTKTTSHDSQIDSLFSSLHSILDNKSSYGIRDVQIYSLCASEIYSRIFEPVVKKKKLIVIPDGPLRLIPVEALVANHQPRSVSFRALPYLIHDHEISYAYSSSILFHRGNKKQERIESVLAFSYTGDAQVSVTGMRDQMTPLPGTYQELKALSKVFKTVSTFSGADALKSNFIQHAKDHDLIHLGVHGVGDEYIADNSRLIFHSDSIGTTDLYAYEIYNLDINANLVVLSACETGIGKQQSGEGMFSIARAFSYAGCPSVLMSLWRVDDRITASIMENFYQELADGRSLTASLRNAKLDFLSGSDEYSSHPANWSAFVLNGEDQSFEPDRYGRIAIWWMIAGLGVIVLYLCVKQKSISF